MFDIELENGQKITAMDLNDFKIKLEDQSAENIYFNYKKDIIFAEHSTRDLKVFVEATYKKAKNIFLNLLPLIL
ncbi:hypothetical protein [Mycoplasmopsis cynos]|uniref:hypothetical protein n=1 Tax=Mycoplasmopsis cynos TaxID=171284 RepID=UPI002200EAB9|nr:hypothetical protein [Mycoplasmopsis cynos]UWV82586.1 hypothetical protein NW067_06610 [Mycoplasmopsis cynos]